MLPDADDLPDLLLDLAVPHEDINELVARRRQMTDAPELRDLLDECVRELLRDPDDLGRTPELGALFASAPPDLVGLFPVYVFLAALPHTLAAHRARGVPAEISRRTLADLGRQCALHRRRHDRPGVHAARWLARHFRGEVHQLGRLQFERTRTGGWAAPGLATAGLPAAPGTPCLNLHIPDFRGPLTPAACDRSLELAHAFFAAHYPEERYDLVLCHSWLLDAQLRDHLPPEAHIVRFQDRFRLAPRDTEPADTEPVRFVFGDADLPVDDLPRRTSLERAVGDHLRSGGHWYIGHGWFPLGTE
ncbi:DUF5596 domain-containing protein [Streptomyces sp. J2-1]|uniref:acyltransferase domain-containing protein n=1 Tax=Streptomyces corallincola TaxID=2851888 RepID=UPI001C3840B2|nr:acyltransferase domain-containing protein [Streptomyces corallincola]MBV2357625.1 DUF5596 domain-containing protein [Streptomyces corallincola]